MGDRVGDLIESVNNVAGELTSLRRSQRRSQRRHWAWNILMGVIVVVLAVVLALVVLGKRHVDAADRERRISGRAQLYSQCQENNAQNERADQAYQQVFAPGFANQVRDPYEMSRTLDVLRQGLNAADCELVFTGVARDEANEAHMRASQVPRLPLPPPTVPGYVPVRPNP